MKNLLLSLWLLCIVWFGIVAIPQVSACNRPWLMLCPSLQVVQMATDDELKPLRLYQVQSTWSDAVRIASAWDTEVIAMYGTIRNNSYRKMSLNSIEFQWVGVQYIDVLRMYSANPAIEDMLSQWFYTWNWKVRLQFEQPLIIWPWGTYDFFLTVDIDPVTPTWSLIRVDHEYKAQWQNIQVF